MHVRASNYIVCHMICLLILLVSFKCYIYIYIKKKKIWDNRFFKYRIMPPRRRSLCDFNQDPMICLLILLDPHFFYFFYTA
jgi:hypothetical protein